MTMFYFKIFSFFRFCQIIYDIKKPPKHLFRRLHIKKPETFISGLYTCARRFELPTPWSVAKCSIQLSYAHIFSCRGTPRMPATGIEPVLYFYNRILSPARLPVPPRRLVIMSGTNRARTYDPLLVRQMLSQLSYDPLFYY